MTLLAVMAGASVAHAVVEVDVTTCGQIVYRGQAGKLTTDLDCSVQWGSCVACATAGPEWCPQIQPVVSCSGHSDCPNPTVNKCDGGSHPSSVGVYLEPGARLYLNGHSIIRAQIGISGRRPDGTSGPQRIRVYGPGIVSKAREAVYFYNGSFSDGVTFTDSLYGIVGSKIRIKEASTSDNVIGVSAFHSLRATGLTSDDNRYAGVVSYMGARLSYSHVSGTDVVDIATERRPRANGTVCDHSAALEETDESGVYDPVGPSWGICSGD
jgi:hypothetical protein